MFRIGDASMAIGDRIKRVRNIRGLTQKELGLAIGFDDKTADVRVAQYEGGTRTPKEDILKKIAETLDVNYRALYEPTLYAAEDVMYALFELDEHYPIRLHEVTDVSDYGAPEKHIAVDFHSSLLDSFLQEWQQRKKDLAGGVICKAEYMEWKVNWPQTADDCGKTEPSKKWRKE
jgi:transcriptional regulator with XRE-family HTH domain